MGILEADTTKQVKMKEKIKKEYSRTRKLLETKLYKRNRIKVIIDKTQQNSKLRGGRVETIQSTVLLRSV